MQHVYTQQSQFTGIIFRDGSGSTKHLCAVLTITNHRSLTTHVCVGGGMANQVLCWPQIWSSMATT